ncbi:MAG: cupin [Rhodospirillaceae bacterium]|nr:cupin [Magnetovibrio sp.]MAY66484.1 cupin [Rhodospirillaceae bacterium]
MKLHADLSKPAIVDSTALAWVPSPAPGVARRMLERDGDEVARATSIVRYAPGSEFPTHRHGGGEEFMVLDGVFSDEHGDFPAGTYVRNPVGSSHAPRTAPGCTIFVKLRQMDPDDQTRIAIDTKAGDWVAGDVPGLFRLPLHEFGTERVWLTRMGPGCAATPHAHPRGEEVLVLDGSLDDENGRHGTGTWLRLPAGSFHAPRTADGCLLWVKQGHLG